jgi:hypothetical protein
LYGAYGKIAAVYGMILVAIDTIVIRVDSVGQRLDTAPERHAPILEKTAGGLAHPHLGCLGFVAAMRLCRVPQMEGWGSPTAT